MDAEAIAKGHLEDIQNKWMRETDPERKQVLGERAKKMQKMIDDYWGPRGRKTPPADLEDRLKRIAEGEETEG